MISIRALEVPDYLHSSPHFENAFQGDDDDLTIDIPADCLKLSTEVETESDLRALLQTVRFWLIPEFLESSADFYTFMINNKDILPQILPDYREDFPILAKLNAAFHFPGNCTLIGRAAQLGMLGLMKYLRDTGTIWDTGVPLCITSIAAEHGQLDCLKYAVDSGCELKREASTLAAKQGHTSCLKYVHEKGANIYMNDCEEAIRNGHVDCVKYMVDSKALNILSPPSVAEIPSRLGNLGMLAYLLSVGCQATVGAASAAAAFDQIECLKLLLNAGCPVNAETLYVAVHCGAIECMKFLHNMGCPWEETTLHIPNNNWVLSACNNPFISFDVEKQISCFEFAAGNGCPVTSAAYALAIKYGSVYLIEVIQSRGVEMDVMPVKLAVRGRQLECLKYLLAQNAPCDTEAYIVAVHAKSLKSIEYLHAHGVPLDLTVSRAAVVQGRVDILRYLLQLDCPVCKELSVAAARSSKASCLQCLHEFGCPLEEDVVSAACEAGALECLQFALANGCPYPADICARAAFKGYLSCLQCLHEHGAPLTAAVLKSALLSYDPSFDCVAYIVSKNCSEFGPIASVSAATAKSSKNLKRIHQLGVPMSIEVALSAIRRNSRECLKYAIENDCPFDAAMPAEAARTGNRGILKALHKAGCPWDDRTIAAAVERDSEDCLEYAVSNGCPFDEVSEEMLERSPRCAEFMSNRGSTQLLGEINDI